MAKSAALWRTDYGRLLLLKGGLLLVVFAIALHNRLVLTGRVIAGDGASARTLAHSIGFEIALALAIFAVAAAWRFTPPPRALAAQAAMPASVHLHTQQAMADIVFKPGRAGETEASIVVMTGEFGQLDAMEVALFMSHVAAGIEPIRRPAQKGADAVWRVERLRVPLPGRWTVRVDILVSDFEKFMLDGAVEIRP